MPVSDLSGARAALYANRLEDLLGLAECSWLDVKGGVYRLEDPAGVEELAKDVAAFANAKTGGLLLVGFTTRKEHDAEVIDQVRPVPRDLVDLDRHRKLIRERVIPAPRDVRIEWITRESDRGILVVDIPTQPPARLPHLVPGPTRTAVPSRYSVAVPFREADATAWLPQGEIQRLLSAGWKETGGPSDEFLGSLIEKAVTAVRREPQATELGIGIGEGEPGWRGPFQQAWNELMKRGLWIGDPSSAVYWDGPGVVQHFEAPHSLFGWVLAALPHRRPVAVEGGIWQALQRSGAAAPGGDALGAVGYPVPELRDTRVVDASSAGIDLTGGRWDDGRLVRDKDTGEWSWEPAVRFDLRMSRAATTWTGGMNPQMLRLRAVATLPWARVHELGITPERRRALEGQLPHSALANFIARLGAGRGANLQPTGWTRGPHQNARDWLSCSTDVGTTDGRRRVEGEVMIALPNATESSVITCAEIRVIDNDSRADAAASLAIPALADFRLSTLEVAEFFIAAWQTATEFLPGAVADEAAQLTWTFPPSVDLRIVAEHRFDGETHPVRFLNDYIDLEPLGSSDRSEIREMAVTVTAPLTLDVARRRELTGQALTYMAEHHGFLDVTRWLP